MINKQSPWELNKPPAERFAFLLARVARQIKREATQRLCKQTSSCLSFYFSLLIRDYTNSSNTSKAPSPLRVPILTILV